MQNYVKEGKRLTFVADGDVSSGDGMLLGGGGLFGVASTDVALGDEGEAVIYGVYEFPKVTVDAPDVWDKAYWDDTEKQVTTVSTGNTAIGYFEQAATNGQLVARVLLTP